MNKVITVNLNGTAYQLEEAAYEKLQAYLEKARTALAGNPDQTEIMRDLEEALGDKCARYRTASKSVVLTEEVETIISEMGPVHGASDVEGDASSEHAGTSAKATGPKKLYRILDGAIIAGVGTGLATYFDVDVVLIRIIFVLLTLVTSGGFILGYILMAIIIPAADTSEAWARAHGIPFSAQKLVDRAHEEFRDFNTSKARRWASKAERRATRRAWKGYDYTYQYKYKQHVGPLWGLMHTALTILFIIGIISLAAHGAAFGIALPVGVPLWAGLIIYCILFSIIRWPIMALGHALSYPQDPNTSTPRFWMILESLLATALVIGGIWYVAHHPAIIQSGVTETQTAWQAVSN
jgi:phage shock protein PspC (stress-responsive transcriptional regulator)